MCPSNPRGASSSAEGRTRVVAGHPIAVRVAEGILEVAPIVEPTHRVRQSDRPIEDRRPEVVHTLVDAFRRLCLASPAQALPALPDPFEAPLTGLCAVRRIPVFATVLQATRSGTASLAEVLVLDRDRLLFVLREPVTPGTDRSSRTGTPQGPEQEKCTGRHCRGVLEGRQDRHRVEFLAQFHLASTFMRHRSHCRQVMFPSISTEMRSEMIRRD